MALTAHAQTSVHPQTSPVVKQLVFTPRFSTEPMCDPTTPALCSFKPKPEANYTITKDLGGVIGIYLAHYKWLKDTHIIVDGLCNSACTLVLANKDVCATDKAWFGFHTASNEAGTAILMAAYPAYVKAWIAAHGGLTSNVIFARGYELLPKCKP